MKAKHAIIVLVVALMLGIGIKKFSSEINKFLELTPFKNLFALKTSYDYDLIIVGSGLAGLTSAFEANKLFNGQKKILILEKMPKFGGNSAKATSGINMLNTPLQEKEGVKDSMIYFIKIQ